MFVVAATNHPDRIDAAVRRAGCLDRGITIGKPDTATLSRIFRHHFGPDTLADASLMPLALAARGTTGADVEAFVRHARMSLRRHVGMPAAPSDWPGSGSRRSPRQAPAQCGRPVSRMENSAWRPCCPT